MNLQQLIKRFANLKSQINTKTPSTVDGKIKCFLSVGYPDSRARVFTGVGNTLDTAYKSAQDRAVKYIKEKDTEPKWLKADLVTFEYQLQMKEFMELASKVRKYYFPYGVSFDSAYNTAFLSQEINAYKLIAYNDYSVPYKANSKIDELAEEVKDSPGLNKRAHLHSNNINNYLKTNRKQKKTILVPTIHNVIIFRTESVFDDQEGIHEIDQAALSLGRRTIPDVTPEIMLDLIEKNSTYLAQTVKEDGSFVYGYYCCFHNVIPTYNTIRHELGVYAMCEAYQMTKDQKLIDPVKRSLNYMVRELIYEKDGCMFAVDYVNNNEIRLGALAVAILAMLKYIEIFPEEQKEYTGILTKLGKGILSMQNETTGNFTHVISYPDLEVVDEFRIIYYSGEAGLALSRLYAFTKEDVWLDAARKAFTFFHENDYWKEGDHWLAYFVNELTAADARDEYFVFGLKNVFAKLDYMLNRHTSWSTFLETLMAAKDMMTTMRKLDKDYLLEGYDLQSFEKAIEKRVRLQLNAIFYPETAMYFKRPEELLYGVYVRHYAFRMRNDDVAHHLCGFCQYYKQIKLNNN